jgi:acyl-CoA synthetase (AMP-forming)/AMP-acid ligase II
MITHGNLAHNLSIITEELSADSSTIVVSWLPQYHDMGLIGSYLGILYCGGTGYYMSPLTFLQRPMLWMEAVAKYQATHLQAPNFSFKLTARKFQADKYTPDSLQLSSVKHVINAAEPIDEDSIETFYKTFGPFGFGKVIFPTYVSRVGRPPLADALLMIPSYSFDSLTAYLILFQTLFRGSRNIVSLCVRAVRNG